MHQLRSPIEAARTKRSSAPKRELAQRSTGSVEVRLLWDAAGNRVEVSLHDAETNAGFQVDVAPAEALEAFYHPYAYAPKDTTAPVDAESEEVDDA